MSGSSDAETIRKMAMALFQAGVVEPQIVAIMADVCRHARPLRMKREPWTYQETERVMAAILGRLTAVTPSTGKAEPPPGWPSDGEG